MAGKTSWQDKARAMWSNAMNTPVFRCRFKPSDPVWLLGVMYGDKVNLDEAAAGAAVSPVRLSAVGFSSPKSVTSPGGGVNPSSYPHLDDLMRDIRSRPWISYRQGFPAISNTTITSDVGWGCMIRSGQMLLAHALVMHTIGRTFRYDPDCRPSDAYIRIIQHFADESRAPFSIHSLLHWAAKDGVKPGDWLGPNIMCRALCRAINDMETHSTVFKHPGEPELPVIQAYLASNAQISRSQVLRTMERGDDAGGSCSILILVPLRLGVRTLNSVYVANLQKMFSYTQCVGMVGGKPNKSFYFMGFTGLELVALDPHICRDACDPTRDVESYHCDIGGKRGVGIRKVPFGEVDPSLAIGFLCRTTEELETFYKFAEDDVSFCECLKMYCHHRDFVYANIA